MNKKGKWIEITTPEGEQKLIRLKNREQNKRLSCPDGWEPVYQ